MARGFQFQLTLLFNQQVDDAAGNWQYAAATAFDPTTGKTAQLSATKRTNIGSGAALPASMLTATLMFPAPQGGVAPNMTLQGVHDLTTNDETGSVSAASPEFADQIGGTFSFTFSTLTLTILPPGAAHDRPVPTRGPAPRVQP
jgi:hypothetical protein